MADERREDEALDTLVIPENFVDTGRCFNGMFRTRNLVEGVAFAALPAYLLVNSPLSLERKIIVTVVVVGIIMVLFINGINGDSFLEFVYHMFVYRGKKRVAKYNPRVKKEATPGYLTENKFELPRDKIIRLYNEFINKNNGEDEEAVSRDIYDPMYKEFFEDDLGYVDTPDDLKTKKELRKEAKERKRQRKEALAREKQERKEADRKQAKETKEELETLKRSSRENDKAIKKERARLKKEERAMAKKRKKGGDEE